MIKAATIGTNPWDERTKKQRRVVGSYTTGPSIRKLEPLLNMETSQMITGLYEDGEGGAVNIIPHIYQKRLALNIILMFCYAKRFEAITDPLLLGILSDANTISRYGSSKCGFFAAAAKNKQVSGLQTQMPRITSLTYGIGQETSVRRLQPLLENVVTNGWPRF